MPTHILAYLKDKLKKLDRLLTIPRFYGPLATIIFTIMYHYGSFRFGYSIAVGWLWLFMIVGAFVGGLWAGLISAAWVAGYSYYVDSEDPTLLIQRIAIGFLMAMLVGWQTQRLRAAFKAADETVNGNVEKMYTSLATLRQAKERLSEVKKLIELTEDRMGNLAAGFVGFTQIRQIIDETIAWSQDPENIKLMQAKEELESTRSPGDP